MTSELKNTSVSHGTMRPEDLIPSFISELDDRLEESTFDLGAETPERVKFVGTTQTKLGGIERRMLDDEGNVKEEYFESDDANYDLESLFDILNEFAPTDCYFGAHPGDGSDYGYWADEDQADEDAD